MATSKTFTHIFLSVRQYLLPAPRAAARSANATNSASPDERPQGERAPRAYFLLLPPHITEEQESVQRDHDGRNNPQRQLLIACVGELAHDPA